MSSRKQPHVSKDKGLQWENIKRKPFRHIYAYSGITRLFRTYSDIIVFTWILFRHIKAYSEPCVSLAYSKNPGIIRTLAYSEPEAYLEPWYSPGMFRIRGVFKTLVYSEPFEKSTMGRFAKIFDSYNHFRKLKLFLKYQLFTFSTFR